MSDGAGGARPLVLYHGGGCHDGFTAAWVARRVLGDAAEYRAVNYGEPPPAAVDGRAVYVLDFSYPRDVLLDMAARAASLVLLDHHESAMQDLAGLEAECKARGGAWDNTLIAFDMARSGAGMAWDYFFPGEARPPLVDLVEDRDLWRFALPDTEAVAAYLRALPTTFAAWDHVSTALALAAERVEVLRAGQAVLAYQRQLVAAICRQARALEIGGHRVLAANTSVLFSEVAGALAEGRPFGAAWYVTPSGCTRWSLRSREGGVNVFEVARQYGGGGHRGAAGFRLERGVMPPEVPDGA